MGSKQQGFSLKNETEEKLVFTEQKTILPIGYKCKSLSTTQAVPFPTKLSYYLLWNLFFVAEIGRTEKNKKLLFSFQKVSSWKNSWCVFHFNWNTRWLSDLSSTLSLKLTKQKMEIFKSSSPLHKYKSKIQYYLQGFSMIPTLRKEKFFRYDFWVSSSYIYDYSLLFDLIFKLPYDSTLQKCGILPHATYITN